MPAAPADGIRLATCHQLLAAGLPPGPLSQVRMHLAPTLEGVTAHRSHTCPALDPTDEQPQTLAGWLHRSDPTGTGALLLCPECSDAASDDVEDYLHAAAGAHDHTRELATLARLAALGGQATGPARLRLLTAWDSCWNPPGVPPLAVAVRTLIPAHLPGRGELLGWVDQQQRTSCQVATELASAGSARRSARRRAGERVTLAVVATPDHEGSWPRHPSEDLAALALNGPPIGWLDARPQGAPWAVLELPGHRTEGPAPLTVLGPDPGPDRARQLASTAALYAELDRTGHPTALTTSWQLAATLTTGPPRGLTAAL